MPLLEIRELTQKFKGKKILPENSFRSQPNSKFW